MEFKNIVKKMYDGYFCLFFIFQFFFVFELQYKLNNLICNGFGGFKRIRSKYKNVIELNIVREMKSSLEFLMIKKLYSVLLFVG